MMTVVTKLWNDEAGFLVSAELVLVATIAVLATVVGLSEVAYGINEELEDVGAAFGSMSQSFCYTGATGHKGKVGGTHFHDSRDMCDSECDITCDGPITGETSYGHRSHGDR